MWPFTEKERQAFFVGALVLVFGISIKLVCLAFPAAQSSLRVLDDTGYLPKIEINRAGYDELVRVSGIGPSSAARIINYRKDHGRIRGPAELAYLLKKKPRAVRSFLEVFKWS